MEKIYVKKTIKKFNSRTETRPLQTNCDEAERFRGVHFISSPTENSSDWTIGAGERGLFPMFPSDIIVNKERKQRQKLLKFVFDVL